MSVGAILGASCISWTRDWLNSRGLWVLFESPSATRYNFSKFQRKPETHIKQWFPAFFSSEAVRRVCSPLGRWSQQ